MLYLAYLDEFGHIGPYVSRDHARFNDSPVFGLGGFVIPYDQVRWFGTYFFKLKCRLLEFEINQSQQKAAVWEKKGSALYTTQNVEKYRELRTATNRLINTIDRIGGSIVYTGIKKTKSPDDANALGLYLFTLGKTLKIINSFAARNDAKVMIVMDEHQDRDAILTAASQAMYSKDFPRRHIIEPPFQVESHRYQTCQCADWLCGLIGRVGAYKARPDEWSEMVWTEKYFEERIAKIAWQSSIRMEPAAVATDLADEEAVARVLAASEEAAVNGGA